jgi:hypothetical protein
MLTKQSRITTGVLTLGLIVGVAGPAFATYGHRTGRCTYSGSVVQQVNSYADYDYTTSNTKTTLGHGISDKGIRSWSMTQFDNTGASGGGTGVQPGTSSIISKSGIWSYQARSRKPYLRIVVTATDGQTCITRISIVP